MELTNPQPATATQSPKAPVPSEDAPLSCEPRLPVAESQRGAQLAPPERLAALFWSSAHSWPLPAGGAQTFVVAVSCGLDSMTLLHLLHHRPFPGISPPHPTAQPGPPNANAISDLAQIPIHVAHIDHRMRQGSDADARWLADLCKHWELPFHLHVAESPITTEAAGRELRYDYLGKLRHRLGPCAVILTAHTKDDQAETVLFRLARGSGLRGLGGVRPKLDSPQVVRPLLDFWRSELEEYADTHNVPHRADPSNEELRWTRNRLRHQILPALKEAVPGADAALAAFAKTAQSESAALAELLDEQLATLASAVAPHQIVIPRKRLAALSDDLLTVLLRRAAGKLNSEPGRVATANLVRFVRESGSGSRLTLAGNVAVEHVRDDLVMSTESQQASRPQVDSVATVPINLGDEGRATIAWGEHPVEVAWGPSLPNYGDFPLIACLSPKVMSFPLTVRPWQPRDRIALPYGKKKVKKLLSEACFADVGIPWVRPTGFPVVATHLGPDQTASVVWVPGLTDPAPGLEGTAQEVRVGCCYVAMRFEEGEPGNP